MGVKLRERHGKDKITLMLDINHNGKRSQENLKLYLEPLIDVATLKPRSVEHKQAEAINKVRQNKNSNILLIAKEKLSQKEIELNLLGTGKYFSNSEKKQVLKEDSLEFQFNEFARSKTRQTKRTYLDTFQCFVKSVLPDTSIFEVNASILQKYIEYSRERGVSENSISFRLSVLKAFFNHLIDVKKIEKSPFSDLQKSLKPKRTEASKSYLTINELNQLINYKIKNKNLYFSFLFASFTGLRYSDIFNLKWSNIKENAITLKQQKTQSVNYIPLTSQAKQILENMNHDSEFVFKSTHISVINKLLKRWVAKAGIDKNITFHSARHTFAVTFLSLSGSLWTLQKLLGHTKIETTLIYGKIIDSSKEKEVANFDKLDFDL